MKDQIQIDQKIAENLWEVGKTKKVEYIFKLNKEQRLEFI